MASAVLVLSMLIGSVIVVVLVVRLLEWFWRREDRRIADRVAQQERRLEAIQRADAEEDRRLLGELRRICEPLR